MRTLGAVAAVIVGIDGAQTVRDLWPWSKVGQGAVMEVGTGAGTNVLRSRGGGVMPTCHVRVANQLYWQAASGGGGTVTASGPWEREWETFTIRPVRPDPSDNVLPGKVNLLTQRGMKVFVDDQSCLSAAQWPSAPPADDVPRLIEHARRIEELERRAVFTLELPSGAGVLTHLGAFVLRAFDGMYVCAENAGGGSLVANRALAAEWETFVAVFHPEPSDACRRVHLRCCDGRHWVSAFGGGGGVVSSTAARAEAWEAFDLVAADQGSRGFRASSRVHLRAPSGHYLQALNGGGGGVTAGGPWPREWETFTLALPDDVARLEPGEEFGLMSWGRQFVSAVPGRVALEATALRRDRTETFVDCSDPVPGHQLEGSQGGVEASISPVTGQSSVDEGATTEQRVGEFVCTSTPVTLTQSFSEALLLDPLTDAVWPGSVIDGLRWVNGEYRLVADDRNPIAVSLSIESLGGAPVSSVVADPRLDTVRKALNQLRGGLVGEALPAQIVADVEEMHSSEQVQVSLQAGYSGFLGKLKAKFDYSSTSTTNKYLWRYQQIYYTADVTPPPSPSGWFASGRAPLPNEMYVASVSYGRMLLFTLESTEDKSAIEGAIEYAKGKSVSASLQAKYESTLSSARINVLVLGGQAALAEEVVTGGVQGIKGYINAGGTFGKGTPAVPLSYRLRFLVDNALGTIALTTSFTRRHCMRATGKIQVEGIQLRVGAVSDPGSNVELFGTVWVSGGIDGMPGAVPISPTGEVWKRDKHHYVTLGRDRTTPATVSPVLTFDNMYRHFDRCYITVAASLYDYDDIGANDHITGGPMVLWLRDLAPGQEYAFPCEGDGNRVYVCFRVRNIEA